MNKSDFNQYMNMYAIIKQDLLPKLNDLRDYILYKETGVSSISCDKIPSHPDPSFIVEKRIGMCEDRYVVEDKIKVLNDICVDIENNYIKALPEDIRKYVIQKYVYKIKFNENAKKGFISKGGLSKAITKAIEKL